MKPEHYKFIELIKEGPHGLFGKNDLDKLDFHVLDALCAESFLKTIDPKSIVDVGSGGGIPAIPLAISFPDTVFHLVESLRWKTDFLKSSTKTLNLDSTVNVYTSRVEEVVEKIGRENVQVGIARAVANPCVVAEYLSPLVMVGGYIVLWTTLKQVDKHGPYDSLLKPLGLSNPTIVPVDSSLRDEAILFVFEKKTECDPKFPRRTGVASKKPLS